MVADKVLLDLVLMFYLSVTVAATIPVIYLVEIQDVSGEEFVDVVVSPDDHPRVNQVLKMSIEEYILICRKKLS